MHPVVPPENSEISIRDEGPFAHAILTSDDDDINSIDFSGKSLVKRHDGRVKQPQVERQVGNDKTMTRGRARDLGDAKLVDV